MGQINSDRTVGNFWFLDIANPDLVADGLGCQLPKGDLWDECTQ